MCDIVRRVQGRGELMAIVRQGHRERKRTVLVLSGANCPPCERLKPYLETLVAEADPAHTRVVWLRVEDAGSDDAYNYCLSRKMTRGVPALFAFTHSSDLFAPDAAATGFDPAAAHALFSTK